jgi:dihydrofolate synthase/folylpolyglutamate synthase
MDYSEAITYLMSFTDMERGYVAQASANPTMSLQSMRSLLSRLNNPHLNRGTVHVTGSKGKGTTSAMIAGILRESGLSTATYSSPHLHSFTERIVIGEEPVSPEEFAAGLDAIHDAVVAEQASVHGTVSTFGVLTALFFWLVRAQIPKTRWQVVEVGLGGTFDATNVFEATDVAVITPISLEHTAILGRTPTAIAADKAGIVKRGTTCVLSAQRDLEVIAVVRDRCRQVDAEFIYVPDYYHVDVTERHVYGQQINVTGPSGTRSLRTPMLGRHQAENVATAVATVDALRARGVMIPEPAIAAGLARTRLHGRLEVMGQRPIIVADGAHNGESANVLAAALKEYFTWKRCFLVLGAMRDKDVGAMGLQLASLADMIICCRFENPRAMDPLEMVQEVGFLGPMAVAEESVRAGIETALGHARADDLVVIAGSLYVVAEAREHILGESVRKP